MTPSDRERLCTCLSFPPNHAPDCPRSLGERLREAGIPTTTVSRLCMETHHDFCALYDCKCSCHERSTGQTEEETSVGTRCIHGVWLQDHCYQCNGPNPAPLTSQNVSAPDWLETELWNFAHAAAIDLGVDNGIWPTSVAEEAIYRNMKMVCKIYASSSNAALRMNVTYERTLKEQWRVRCIAAESNQHETEAERDEWKRQSLALVVLLKAKCSDAEWAGMNAKFDAALGDPPEKGTV